jgi:hypothetical protein
MKRISKPELPIEIYTFPEIMSTNEYRRLQEEAVAPRRIGGGRKD